MGAATVLRGMERRNAEGDWEAEREAIEDKVECGHVVCSWGSVEEQHRSTPASGVAEEKKSLVSLSMKEEKMLGAGWLARGMVARVKFVAAEKVRAQATEAVGGTRKQRSLAVMVSSISRKRRVEHGWLRCQRLWARPPVRELTDSHRGLRSWVVRVVVALG